MSLHCPHCRSPIDLADLDTHSRMQGLRRIVANFGMQAKTAQVERRGEL